MNRNSIAALLLVACCMSAHGQESVVLCSSPLAPDCVDPKWGQIEPEYTGGGGSASTEGVAPEAVGTRGMHIAVRLQTVALRDAGRAAEAAVKAVIDGGAKFKRETDQLTAAIKRARFDRSGRIVRGEEQIAQAALAASRAAPNYALTLYIKAPSKLSPDQATFVGTKVAAINRVLENASATDQAGKPQS